MSIDEWLQVRAYLQKHRYELAKSAAGLYPRSCRVEETDLLAPSSWIPGSPLDIDSVSLSCVRSEIPSLDGWTRALGNVLPDCRNGAVYRGYSDAMARLAAPRIFENRSTYRLIEADLLGPEIFMNFGRGTYFDSIDVGEACAHEYAAVALGITSNSAVRTLIGNPWDLGRRPVNVAISTLTLRVDDARGDVTFPLHWRDPSSVGHAGGLYQVLPVGIFQASNDEHQNQLNDFDFWRCMLREFAEELLGASEEYGPSGTSIDYQAWPFARQIADARANGSACAWILGMGVDPLTFATDLLTVVTFNAPVFDELFGSIVDKNVEGKVLFGEDHALRFTGETIDRFTQREPMQAAGAALLRLAWRHRHLFLS